ncbi:hypothetical protein EVAR_29334_1 [Eumeta japonica]|uniref:Uncharacterized protein n=1 Tax=Eumeta variegata TaxID=151549 RepID=A0A4C1WKD3_EUMVA|nr:hypothetical protein EVAR_29334_1 [Eumeta japonica]
MFNFSEISKTTRQAERAHLRAAPVQASERHSSPDRLSQALRHPVNTDRDRDRSLLRSLNIDHLLHLMSRYNILHRNCVRKHPQSIARLIVDDTQVSPLGLLLSMGGGDHLLSDSSHARLPLINPI